MLEDVKTLEFQNDEFVNDSNAPIRAARADEARLGEQIVQMGFAADPIARWVWADPAIYQSVFPEFIRAFAGNAFKHGTAFIAAGNRGAALWLPPGVGSDEEALMRIVESTVPPLLRRDLYGVLEQMGGFHPKEPHWYLPMIATDPFFQGRGIGGMLMRYALERCDEENMPAYLESSNPRNITLYQRCGFEVIGIIRSGGSPPMFPMLRKPRPYAY